jgi:hypothetical protein
MHSSDPLGTVQVPLAWLEELDSYSSANCLPKAFGDRYLYSHNPVFAAVRDSAISLGYGFSCADTPLWRDYQSFSLLTLHEIMSGRLIPYLDNATTFQRLVERDSTAALPLRFIHNNMSKNHVFHESGHCVAHHFIKDAKDDLNRAARSLRESYVLSALLEESFANTVEMLGNAFLTSLPDTLFYGLNSFTVVNSQTRELLRRSRDYIGDDARFIVLCLAYLEANLSIEEPTDEVYQRIREMAECPAGCEQVVKALVDLAMSLNLTFRQETTPAYFRLLGYSDEYSAVTSRTRLADDTLAMTILRMVTQLQRIVVPNPNSLSASGA